MTDTEPSPTVWLTQDAFSRLTRELAELAGPNREALARKIGEAREEGDLRENGGYHAAKEEQGKSEARIRQLEALLRSAKVGEPPATDGERVTAGQLVEVRYEDGTDDDENETFLLGSREDRIDNYPIYSPSSPLGRAVMGAAVGDVVSYLTPRSKTLKVTVVSVRPYSG